MLLHLPQIQYFVYESNVKICYRFSFLLSQKKEKNLIHFSVWNSLLSSRKIHSRIMHNFPIHWKYPCIKKRSIFLLYSLILLHTFCYFLLLFECKKQKIPVLFFFYVHLKEENRRRRGNIIKKRNLVMKWNNLLLHLEVMFFFL